MWILRIMMAVAVAGAIIVVASGIKKGVWQHDSKQIGVMKIEAAPEIAEETVPREYKIQMNAAPVYKAGGAAPGDVAIYNAEENHFNMQVSYIEEESGHVLYESEQISPGTMIAAAPLAQTLPAGEYPAIARITWSEDGRQVGDVCEMEIVLIINS